MIGSVQARVCGTGPSVIGHWATTLCFSRSTTATGYRHLYVSHSDVQYFSGWFEGDARGITTGQLNAFHHCGFCVNDVDGAP